MGDTALTRCARSRGRQSIFGGPSLFGTTPVSQIDELDGSEEMDRDEEPCSTLKPSCDAQTQWSDPEMEDHTYSKGPTITCRASTTPSPELSCPVADNVLKSDADSLLYTGIPLIAFHTLVTCLQPFAPTSSSMPVVDHILMTLMKLRLNFVMTVVVWRNG
ncbi:unnamed protein product [Leuciscus chuanchicus]